MLTKSEQFQRVDALRDALRGLWAAGDHLNNYRERVQGNLRILGQPTESDFDRAFLDRSKPLVGELASNDWAVLLRELESRLHGWHDSMAEAAEALKNFPNELIDDARMPMADWRSTAIRRSLDDVNGWLWHTGPSHLGKQRNGDVANFLTMLANGAAPTMEHWTEQLRRLNSFEEFLFPLWRQMQNWLERVNVVAAEPAAETLQKGLTIDLCDSEAGRRTHGANPNAASRTKRRDNSTATSDSQQRAERIKKLTKTQRKVYWSWCYAKCEFGDDVTDRNAHKKLLKLSAFEVTLEFQQAHPEYCDELEGFMVQKTYSTWYSALHEARSALDEKRYQRRLHGESRSAEPVDESKYWERDDE